jgi:ankyrin repeat protein
MAVSAEQKMRMIAGINSKFDIANGRNVSSGLRAFMDRSISQAISTQADWAIQQWLSGSIRLNISPDEFPDFAPDVLEVFAYNIGELGLHNAPDAWAAYRFIRTGSPVNGLTKILGYQDDYESEHWETPLLTSLVDGRLDVAEVLLRNGANANAWNVMLFQSFQRGGGFNCTTLMKVIGDDENKANEIDLLLQYGADINRQNSAGETALQYAIGGSHVSNARHLLARGANGWLKNQEGLTPFDYAYQKAKTGRPEFQWAAEILMQYGRK